jgi:hypothetical protein
MMKYDLTRYGRRRWYKVITRWMMEKSKVTFWDRSSW